jgi:class 3 adenylate cyclase/tetratricopeptide (TPR) repeat protein
MAEVFLARSFGVAGFEKRLVIKRIRAEYAQDPRFVSMFINEAKISVHLNHPNVVQVYDLNKVGTTWYIAMEHLHGRDLNRLVKTLRAIHARLPLPVAVAIVAEACRGLAYAHGRTDAGGKLLGLVHRDVSPHNLIVTFDGEVKLVDFGIARLMSTEQSPAPTAPGRPGGGKYAYMSPEQARGEPVDHRTDIFSAGIVLWELIVGHRLFQDPDPAEKLRRVQEAVIPDPSERGAPIDGELWAILSKALAKNRDDRHSSAAVLEEDLRAWLFRSGHRLGRAEIAAEMRRAFPGEGDQPAADLDLHRMVADVEQLDAATSGTQHSSGTGTGGSLTPTEALPGRLGMAIGERKSVVVLIVDVDGLTDLSARLEPELLFRHHYQLLRLIRRSVGRFGGLVQRAIDDQVMILFGVPRTRADDVARALECAQELHKRVADLHTKGFHVDLAIGVHQGEVTVGPGPGVQFRYAARGNTTRLARRLSAVADHGQVLVSERILAAAGADFRLKRGPDVANRAGRPPDASYLLEGRRRGFRVHGKGGWLKRGAEIEVIRDALVGLTNGRGQTIVLTGPEGTGKSRLVREIRDLAARRGIPVHLGRCGLSADDALEPLADFVREVLGIEEAAMPDTLGELAELGLSRADCDALAALVSHRARSADDDETWAAIARLLMALARDGAVIVALEDLHQLAQRNTARLARLAQAIAAAPVLLLLTARGSVADRAPSRSSRLGPGDLQAIGTVVELGAFATSAQRRLLRNLLDVEHVDDALVALVERTCEGNPLYIEEMVKYLINGNRLVLADGTATLSRAPDDPGIPDSLAGLIAARIDRLDPAAKGSLQLAAVIGRAFTSAVLGRAAGIDDPMPLITELVSHGLVVREHPTGDSWSFASELVREVTLRGILGVQRKDYHRLVAAALETAPATIDRDEALARHCAGAGRLIDAARFAHRAGETWEKQNALERAAELFASGLKWIREVPERPETWDARVQGEATLALRLGTVQALLGDTKGGERLLQLALDVAADARLPWIEVRAHIELGRSYLHRGRNDLAAAHLGQARDLLDSASDPGLAVEALEASAILAHEEGRNGEAEDLWNEALRRASGDPAAVTKCLIGLSNRHLRAGALEAASPLLDRALRTARDAGDRILEGRVLNNIGLLHAGAARFDDAIASFRQALEVREGIGYQRGVVVNHHNIGDVHFARGDFARAHVAFTRSRELATEMGWERGLVLNDVYLGYIEASRGQADGLERVKKATRDAEKLGDADTATAGAWLAGRFLLEQGKTDDAKQTLERALSQARKYDLRPMISQIETMIASLG